MAAEPERNGGEKLSQGFTIAEILRAKRRNVKSSDGESSSSSTPPGSPSLQPRLQQQLPVLSFPAGAQYAPSPILLSPHFLSRTMPYSILLAGPLPPLQCHHPAVCGRAPPSSPAELAGTAAQQHRISPSSDMEESDDCAAGENCGSPAADDKASDGEAAENRPDSFKKKKRTAFTTAQLQELEGSFSRQKYLTKADRTRLAKRLGLTEKHVKTWYQNRRTKWKRGATELEWSAERERSATAMYHQFVCQKNSIFTP